jgi:hypothetical protein
MQLSRYLKHLDSLIAAIIGFYAIHLFTAYSGIGISPDSIMYASTATNIQAHGSLVTFNGNPIVFFPVFYPFFLGMIQLISRVDPIAAGSVINSFLFASVIFMTGWMVTKFKTQSLIYKWLILIALILSPALLQIYSFLWSETLFIVEVSIFILIYHNYLQKHTTKALLLAALVAAIGCITRYAGVTIIGAGGLMLLLDSELAWGKKIKHILIFSFSSISLLVINLVYNRLTSGLSTGTREPSITPFDKNLYLTGTVLNDWGALGEFADRFAIPIAAVVLVGIIALLLWKAYKGQLNSYENVCIAFAIVYGLFIVISATISRYEQINSRLLAPMFVPLLIACTGWVPDVLKPIKSIPKYALTGVAVIMMLAFEYFTLKADLDRYDSEGDYGVPGYADDDWNKSPFVEYLRAHKHIFKAGIPVYTDADEAVYLFTGMQSHLVPHEFFKKDVAKFYTHKQFYLIWFDNVFQKELVPLTEILKNKKLVKIADTADGDVYLCDEK